LLYFSSWESFFYFLKILILGFFLVFIYLFVLIIFFELVNLSEANKFLSAKDTPVLFFLWFIYIFIFERFLLYGVYAI
jgi:hypothetical protein